MNGEEQSPFVIPSESEEPLANRRQNMNSKWQQAKDYGIDMTLIDANLQKSFDERLNTLQSMLDFALELRRAGNKLHAKISSDTQTSDR